MAEAIQRRNVRLLENPATVVNIQPFWQQPKGLNFSVAPNRLGPTYATEATNVRLNRGYFVSRGGLGTYGPITGVGANQMQVVNFIKSTGESFVIRFDTDHIYLYNGLAWVVFTGAAAFTGSTLNTWTYTAWNDTLIVSNGVDGTYTLDPVLVTVAIIAAAPPAKQLSTYAGRVIASNTKEIGVVTGNRIRWSVKNSSTDWSGIGSGFEDLLSTPGGQSDILNGVFPVSEEAAFIIRTNSIWQMQQTGDPNAPFRFSRTYNQVGSIARNSIQSTPDGVVFFSTDNIYYVTLSGIQTIGDAIRTKFRNIVDITMPWGLYNPLTREYHLGVGEATATAFDVDWVYSFLDAGWTRYVFPFNFASLGYTRFTVSGPIDSLLGTIDNLLNTIDNQGLQQNGEGMFVVAATAGKYITILDTARHTDVTFDGADQASPISLATGTIAVQDTRHRTKIIAVELEYEATVAQTLTFKTSSDGGQTWVQMGASKAIAATTKPELLKTVGVVTRNASMIQVSSTTLGFVTIESLYAHVVQDGAINP